MDSEGSSKPKDDNKKGKGLSSTTQENVSSYSGTARKRRKVSHGDGIPTLAFPSISTADFQFNPEKASDIIVEKVEEFMNKLGNARLILVDLTQESKILASVRAKAAQKNIDPKRFFTFVGDITKMYSKGDFRCNVIANAANWRLKPGGGGVNAAIFNAGGPALQAATLARAESLLPGNALVVPLPKSSPLYRKEGVTHVIHVLGPNMNPDRPDCLNNDYIKGCKVLQDAYSSLFKAFFCITRNGYDVPTLAFPSISTAEFQFDLEKASSIIVEKVEEFMDKLVKARLVLVDLTHGSKILSLVKSKAAEKNIDSERFFTFVGDITRLYSEGDLRCNIIANTANWRLKPGGGGVNAAIFKAGGPALEAATKNQATTLIPGNAVVVPLPLNSPLYIREGVTHVIHVLGPNMNPERPNCLDNDYIKGCKILQDAYSSLFELFLSIAETQVKFTNRSSRNILSGLSVPEDKISGTMAKSWPQWLQSLYNIAMQPEKYKDEVVEALDDVVVLNDKYPKAKRHLLVLARLGGLDCLEDVRKEHLQLLLTMHEVGLKWTHKFLHEDASLIFRLGYHSVPSLRQLHLHVISQDFDSKHLKTKRHWNTFNTDFFRDSLDVIEEVSNHGKAALQDDSRLLSMELCCHRCRSVHPNLPMLKSHIRKCQAPFPDALQKNGRLVLAQSYSGCEP